MMMLSAFAALMETVAPKTLALSFDNVGLLVSPANDEIRRVLVALDCSDAVANEAVAGGYDLVLTHHPRFFSPVQRILRDDPATSAVYTLIRGGVGLFAAHTNWDAAEGGVNDTLCEMLGVRITGAIDDGVGRVGTLPEPITLRAFAQCVKDVLCANISLVGAETRRVERVAVLGGSGSSAILPAREAGADVLVTGEIAHHHAQDAESIGLAVIAAGHYETERVALVPLIARLQSAENDVQYTLSRADASPFARF